MSTHTKTVELPNAALTDLVKLTEQRIELLKQRERKMLPNQHMRRRQLHRELMALTAALPALQAAEDEQLAAVIEKLMGAGA